MKKTTKYKLIYILTPLLFIVLNQIDVQAQVLKLSLDSCIQMAVRNNVKVKNANLDIKSAEQEKNAVFTKYFPQISGMAVGFYSDKPLIEYGISDIGNAGIRDVLQSIYSKYGPSLGISDHISFLEKGMITGISAMQPLYMGGRIVIGNKLAELGVDASLYQAEIAKQEVMMQTEELYWQILSLEEKKNTVVNVLELIESLYKDVDCAVNAGLTTQNDLLRVNLKRNEMKSNLIRIENGICLSKMALCQYIGLNRNDSIAIIDSVGMAENPVVYHIDNKDAVAQRYESKLLDLSINAEKLKRRMILGEALPQIGFGGTYAYNNLMEKDYTNLIGFASIQLPISAWWETSHKLKKHNYLVEKAQNTKNDLTERLELQTQQVYDELDAAYRQITLAEEAVEDAKKNQKLSNDYYHAGLVPLSEMLESQTLYRQALDQCSDAQINYRIRLSHYKQLIGK